MTSYPSSPAVAPTRIDISKFLVDPPKELTWTTWPAARPDQKHVATDGWCTTATWARLCRWVEVEHREGPVYAKGRGPQWAPVANVDGHRCIESTTAMYAFTFDCDGVGDWDTILAYLNAAGAAYLAYQSPGHTPEMPKWRLVLLLAEPYVTQGNTTEANKEWHRLYEHVRVIAGPLAGFADPVNSGFDHTTGDTARIYYLGHRRAPDVPVREVRWRGGLALDGAALLVSTPMASTRTRTPTTNSPSPTASSGGLQMLDLTTPGHTDTGFYTEASLRADTLITLTRDGVDVGTVKFRDVQSRSHCRCPKHGGSGRGSAWVDRTPQGVRLRCSRCCITWHREIAIKPIDPAVLAAIKAEEAVREAAENAACDRRRKYVEPFADRVAARYEAAAIYDLEPDPDRPRTPAEQADADNARGILTAATRAVKYARDLAPLLRARWAAAGLVHRREGCGALPQGLVDYTTGTGLHIGRVCGRDDCAYCGPWRVALRAGAVLQMPVLDAEGRIAGAPMGNRDVWLFRIERVRLEAWQAAFGRELRQPRTTTVPDAAVAHDSPGDAGATGIGVLDLFDARPLCQHA